MASSSSSSDEDFIPLGIAMLNITPQSRGASVMARKHEGTDFGLPPQLQYMALIDAAMAQLNKASEERAERTKLPLKIFKKDRKTFVNVSEIADKLSRQPDHLARFLAEHLYTEGSVNKDGNLVLNGLYLQSNIEKGLRNFIELYVVCRACDAVDGTSIVRENKLYFLKCDHCKSQRCVGNVIEGLNLKEKVKPKLRGLV